MVQDIGGCEGEQWLLAQKKTHKFLVVKHQKIPKIPKIPKIMQTLSKPSKAHACAYTSNRSHAAGFSVPTMGCSFSWKGYGSSESNLHLIF